MNNAAFSLTRRRLSGASGEPVLRVISLGAGVQSSTLLLMALRGEFDDAPDCAIFADTQWESKATYRHLEFLEREAARFNFPIFRVTAGDIRRSEWNKMPLFVRNLDGETGMLNRQCTQAYKLAPINRKIRQLVGLEKGERSNGAVCELWLGISLDEASRMRDSREKWKTHRYPLVERLMRRKDCLEWLAANCFPKPPKSACLGCPFHATEQWHELKQQPDEWQSIVEYDEQIRRGVKGGACEAFLHSSLKPINEVDFQTAEERGQLNLFLNECEGLCGT